MSEQQIKETKKSNNQRRRKNYRNRRKNPVKTQQKIQEVKKSDEYKSVQEIAEKLASVFADLAEDVENCKKVIPVGKAEGSPEFTEHLGNMSGILFALSTINEYFPLTELLQKDVAAVILSIVEDKDMCDFDEGICYDELD